jgi:hypothetical protein
MHCNGKLIHYRTTNSISDTHERRVLFPRIDSGSLSMLIDTSIWLPPLGCLRIVIEENWVNRRADFVSRFLNSRMRYAASDCKHLAVILASASVTISVMWATEGEPNGVR